MTPKIILEQKQTEELLLDEDEDEVSSEDKYISILF